MAKIFKCKDIPYYITGCPDKTTAAMVAIKNHWGVTLNDLIEDTDAYVVDKFYSE